MLDGVRWILFDAVGTLIYADPPVAEVYYAAARPFGSRLTVAEVGSRFHPALAAEQGDNSRTSEPNERERWRRIVSRVIDDTPGAGPVIFEQLWQHFARPESWQLYDDVSIALVELNRRGLKLGIASNFDARLIPIVRGHPPLAVCKAVFVSSHVGYTKPDPRFFQAIEAQLGVSPEQIALVGDDELSDVAGATRAGWRAILLDRAGACQNAKAIRSLAELL
jgi:putative hydrolase of the HAD superfamily